MAETAKDSPAHSTERLSERGKKQDTLMQLAMDTGWYWIQRSHMISFMMDFLVVYGVQVEMFQTRASAQDGLDLNPRTSYANNSSHAYIT